MVSERGRVFEVKLQTLLFKLQILYMPKTKWVIDPAHSEIQFKVKHLMITTVTGYFRTFDLQVEAEADDFSKVTSIVFTANSDSIDTANSQRDTHLKSDDFFNAEKFNQIKFTGKDFKKSGDGYELTGDLTIRDITKPITLDVEYGGTVTDPYGQTKAGFNVTGKIKRKEYNLMWDAVTEAGQVVVSNDIKIHCEIQLIRQTAGESQKATSQSKEAVS
jgi:polyisoprenoid-binding protein YceI